jgi:hypothetical protein
VRRRAGESERERESGRERGGRRERGGEREGDSEKERGRERLTERDLSAKTSAYFAFCFSPRRAKLSRAASKVCAGDRKEEGEGGGGVERGWIRTGKAHRQRRGNVPIPSLQSLSLQQDIRQSSGNVPLSHRKRRGKVPISCLQLDNFAFYFGHCPVFFFLGNCPVAKINVEKKVCSAPHPSCKRQSERSCLAVDHMLKSQHSLHHSLLRLLFTTSY